MPESIEWIVVHDTACTNTTLGSCVEVIIAANLLSWEIPDNKYGDKLPIIPSPARVEKGKILYRLSIKAIVRRLSGGPLSGRTLAVKSDRSHDTIRIAAPTDSDGCTIMTLETREAGEVSLTILDHDITGVPLRVTLKEAWYENTFLITGYHVCFEDEFSGAPALARGIGDHHKSDFCMVRAA
ncbi:hypothetical protein M3A49_04650 [Paraburkholderia sp. CNPSo 3076]|uniref:hypothetical protein n=1 Tax=Paraburkholderia sp. CNPSo 3076 TaxID=2940936 RepID=UPI00224E42CF|nr:hypothetical protein [Paraburkholderia sp. CNPSo 3076]MCX5538791.1 hypothetical protein [Paraburkholderia sp. CNPSo 3076]